MRFNEQISYFVKNDISQREKLQFPNICYYSAISEFFYKKIQNIFNF